MRTLFGGTGCLLGAHRNALPLIGRLNRCLTIGISNDIRMQLNKEQRERLLAMRRQQREAPKSSSLLAVWYSVRTFIKTVLRAARSIVSIGRILPHPALRRLTRVPDAL